MILSASLFRKALYANGLQSPIVSEPKVLKRFPGKGLESIMPGRSKILYSAEVSTPRMTPKTTATEMKAISSNPTVSSLVHATGEHPDD
jgi:hypothetical protein